MSVTRKDIIKEYVKNQRGIEFTDEISLIEDGNHANELTFWEIYSGDKETGIRIYFTEYLRFLEEKFHIMDE